MKFKTWNLITGWTAFLISFIVYFTTIAPSASFWDCGEFIASAYKLEVCHPPGAPLFLLIGRIFSMFAGSNPGHVALMVNSLSALASAFTILFLFWTITHFAFSMTGYGSDFTTIHKIVILGSGLIGALAFAFTDSFWFSAVESEVYAFSSMITAVTFWAILRWEERANTRYAARWLLFIAFLTGLSIGVHLLNLLAIPAIVFIFIRHNRTFNLKNVLLSLLISLLILVFLLNIFIPGVVQLAAFFDRISVNNLHFPFHSGTVIYIILLAVGITFGLWYTHKKKLINTHTLLLGLAYLLIGYSSYALVIIRSVDNPPIDMNNPDNPFSLVYYLNREQYVKHPLFYGNYYNAPVASVKNRYTYIPFGKRYIKTPLNPEYKYDRRFMTFFPRMTDNSGKNADAYKNWGKVKGIPIKVNRYGKENTLYKPSFTENLRFFFRYQLGHMYFRYFMWNFTGRQNDIQGFGGLLHGNWITGINFLDDFRLGPQEKLPDELRNNKAHNSYFLIPLLLGLLGFFYQYRSNRSDWYALLLLFFFTGIAIVLYLNEVPVTPRERDYVHVGSFYVFGIWIGLGVYSLYAILHKKINEKFSVITAILIGFSAPLVLIFQNYNDHNRSNRYVARDIAKDCLDSCSKNAILFTSADNDTYPIWYAKEVENIRPDVKVVLLPYLGAEWYIDQMRTKSGNAQPLPVSIPPEKFLNGARSYIPLMERIKIDTPLKDVLEFIVSDNSATKVVNNDSDKYDYCPARKLVIPVDKKYLIQHNIVRKKDTAQLTQSVHVTITENYIYRSQLILLDVLAQNNWKRPVYFTNTEELKKLGLDKYVRKEGLLYRLVPFKPNNAGPDEFYDLQEEYSQLMKTFTWGNISDRNVYCDWTIVRQLSVIRLRSTFEKLASEFIEQGNKQIALEVLDRCRKLTPPETVPNDLFTAFMVNDYFQAGAVNKGDELLKDYAQTVMEYLDFYGSLDVSQNRQQKNEIGYQYSVLNELYKIAQQNNRPEIAEKIAGRLQLYSDKFSSLF
jgi:MFS family permease